MVGPVLAFLGGEHAPAQALRLFQAPQLERHLGQVVERAQRELVVGAEHLVADVERAFVERFGGDHVASALEVTAERREREGEVGVVGRQGPLFDRHRAAQQRFGLLDAAEHQDHPREIRQRLRGGGVFVAELLLADADHLFGQRPQRLPGVGIQVDRKLILEPARVPLRVGLAAVVLRLGQRAARRRGHVLRA